MNRPTATLASMLILGILYPTPAGAQKPPNPEPEIIAREATTLEPRPGGIQRAEAPAAFELRCRGGAALRFVVNEGRINSSGEATSYVTVYLEHAAQATGEGGRNLQPGRCAFPDRTLRTDEPYEIFLEMVSFGQTRQQLNGTSVDTTPTAAERYPDAQNIQQYMGDPNHYWSFFVRQNAPLPFGRFEASSSRHWKPAPGIQDSLTRPIESQRAEYRARADSHPTLTVNSRGTEIGERSRESRSGE